MGEPVTGMAAITAGITSVMSVTESMLTAITGNTILVVILAAGFVSLGLRVLRKLFSASESLG